MTITFSGDINTPIWGPDNEIYVQGSIIVYPEQISSIIIGGQVITAASFQCSRSNTSKIGDCEIIIPDASGTLKNLIEIDDEIRIFFKHSSETEPTMIWRGFVTTSDYGISSGQVLKIKGAEITKILFETTVTKSYVATELATIVKEILNTNAPVFDTSLIVDTGRTISVNFSDEKCFDAINTVLKPYNHRLIINNDYTVEILFRENLLISVDTVDVTNIENISESDDSPNLYNKVTVQGASSAITYTAENTSSSYRTKEIKLIRPELQYAADVQVYAETILNNAQEPTKKYSISCELLSHTSPGQKIELDYPTTTLTGGDFEVRTITYVVNNNSHRTTLQIEDDTQYFEELIAGMNQGLYKTMLKTYT